jgi:hypothetical protein
MSETGIRAFLNPAQMGTLNRLALNSRYVVEGTLAGRHRSAQKGASTEFADHRSYIAGDDLKRIDWKVLGRTDKYFVRRYQDETNTPLRPISRPSSATPAPSPPPSAMLCSRRATRSA